MTKRKSENSRLFHESEINWEELAAIGILRDDLELEGCLDALLQGRKAGPVHLSLVLLGMEVELDATLQLVQGKDAPLLEITGMK